MSRRKRKCHDAAGGLPGGLRIESFIESRAGDCLVDPAEQAAQIVRLSNRTLLRFSVTILAKAGSGNVHYNGTEGAWEQNVEIAHRPLSGGPRERTLKRALSCDGESPDESVEVTIAYQSIGCKCTGHTTLQLQFDARG
jgi:hypothetical protein